MNKSTITRERLEKIKSWRETYGAGSNVMLPAEEAEELACIALAAMDSEPVAFINGAWTLVYYRPPKESGLKIGDKLYRHAQQQVVPDIDELRLAFEAAERESDDGFNLHKYGIGYADDETQGRWDTWLACRAAMLNGGK